MLSYTYIVGGLCRSTILRSPDGDVGGGANPAMPTAPNAVATEVVAAPEPVNRVEEKKDKPKNMALVPRDEIPAGSLPERFDPRLITATGRLIPFTEFVSPRLQAAGIPTDEDIKRLPEAEAAAMKAKKKGIIAIARQEHNALAEQYDREGTNKILQLVRAGDIQMASYKPRVNPKTGRETYNFSLVRSAKTSQQEIRELREKLKVAEAKLAEQKATIDIGGEPVPPPRQ